MDKTYFEKASAFKINSKVTKPIIENFKVTKPVIDNSKVTKPVIDK